ncbi:MAG: N-acetyl sugar amidotransferase [Raineya sp.]|nr:N-acetyl sugar amidotransferase [Raineya sp.]
MKYCKKCLQPNTRPNTNFDNRGICPACNYYENLKEIDWEEHQKELKEIVEFGKRHNHSGYDCIIGVSGGKDSTRQALFVRNILKMKPLLVCLSYPPEQVTQRGVDNISNLIAHGFDCISINPAPVVWKNLMKKGFLEYGNWAKSTELALFSSVPRLAIAYQIPLIWWGENPALQLGDLKTQGKTGSDGNNLKHLNTLGGGDITWLLTEEIRKNQILQYIYPSDEEMQRANLRIVFLGYFWKDWSLLNNGNYSALRGLDVRQEKPEHIGEPYGVTSLDEDWVSLNQMIKYLKFGFGRTTDYMNEEIRKGTITREEAISLVEKYDGTCSEENIENFCKYIGISVQEFWEVVDKFVNKDLFEKNAEGKWVRKFKVGQDYEV